MAAPASPLLCYLLYVTIHCSISLTAAVRAALAVVLACHSPIQSRPSDCPAIALPGHTHTHCITRRRARPDCVQRSDSVADPANAKDWSPPATTGLHLTPVSSANTARCLPRRRPDIASHRRATIATVRSHHHHTAPSTRSSTAQRWRRRHPARPPARYMRPPTTAR